MKSILTLSLAAILLANTTGCVGMMIRSAITEKTPYATAMAESGVIAQERSRFVIYSAGGGPNIWNTAGRIANFSIDGHVYRIAGNSYFIVDLPSGEHEVTFNNVMKQKLFKLQIQKGEDSLRVDSRSNGTTFLRVSVKDPNFIDASMAESDHLMIERVTEDQAIPELDGLKFYLEYDAELEIDENQD